MNNSVTQLFSGVFEIFALVISLAVLATLVTNASGTSQVIQASTSGLSGLIRTAMGQSGGISAMG
jgi:hypothetical protein